MMRNVTDCGDFWNNNGGTMMGFFPWSQLILLVVLLIGVYFIVRVFREKNGKPAPINQDASVQALRLRYANGEINDEEYQKLLTNLEKTKK